jgi:hypothetical protein
LSYAPKRDWDRGASIVVHNACYSYPYGFSLVGEPLLDQMPSWSGIEFVPEVKSLGLEHSDKRLMLRLLAPIRQPSRGSLGNRHDVTQRGIESSAINSSALVY